MFILNNRKFYSLDIDITGFKSGQLTALTFIEYKNRCAIWLCKCTCGNTINLGHTTIINKRKVTCGNCNRPGGIHIKVNHLLTPNSLGGINGITCNPLYNTWYAMLSRCLNPKNENYPNYGGRGITVCDRWMDLRNFFKDMYPKPIGLTLERIDNNGNYEKSNCKWATYSEQNSNQRKRRIKP